MCCSDPLGLWLRRELLGIQQPRLMDCELHHGCCTCSQCLCFAGEHLRQNLLWTPVAPKMGMALFDISIDILAEPSIMDHWRLVI